VLDPAGAVAAMEHHIKIGWDEFRSNYQRSKSA
jgi:hypothetical protein